MSTTKEDSEPAMGMPNGRLGNHHHRTGTIHQGFDPRLSEGAAAVPIFTTSTFAFSSAQAGADAFHKAFHGVPGGELIYSRLNHPNAEILENRLASIEPGAGAALVFNSGMSAITMLTHGLLAFLEVKDQIGSGNWRPIKPEDSIEHARCVRKGLLYGMPVYGGTGDYFEKTLKLRLGFDVLGIDMSNIENSRTAMRKMGDNLGMVFLETPANPTMSMLDISRLAAAAKEANPDCVVVVDNTFMGVFQHPFEISEGVDLTLYSMTKFLGGRSHVIGGAIMARAGKEHLLGPINGQRLTYGTILPPFECWQIVNTLPEYELRMREQARIATIVAEFLQKQTDKVYEVRHPSLLEAGEPDYEIFLNQCCEVVAGETIKGSGSLIAFKLKGADQAMAFKFLDAVASYKASTENGRCNSVILLAVSLGGVESLIEHPASMTHSELLPEEQVEQGITMDLIRLSIGLEDPEDLIAALQHGLDQI